MENLQLYNFLKLKPELTFEDLIIELKFGRRFKGIVIKPNDVSDVAEVYLPIFNIQNPAELIQSISKFDDKEIRMDLSNICIKNKNTLNIKNTLKHGCTIKCKVPSIIGMGVIKLRQYALVEVVFNNGNPLMPCISAESYSGDINSTGFTLFATP